MLDPVLIIPCSGIGKAFGSISREATYCVVEDLKKGETDTVCLSLLVMGDEDAVRSVKAHRCIAVDGCPNECSKKNLQSLDAKLAASYRVVDVLRENRNLKPNSIAVLDEDGRKLARILAEKITSKINELNDGGRSLMNALSKIGVVSCSGECCAEGTISRVATRTVLEKLRPDNTVTICLPLFSIGEKGERMFAKFFPTIAVDGCDRKCAKNAIEKYSGKTACSIVVSDLLKEWGTEDLGSRRQLNKDGLEAATKVAEEIAASMDAIFKRGR